MTALALPMPIRHRLTRKNALFSIGATLCLLLALIAALAPLIAPYDPTAMSLNDKLLAPSMRHPFGTDTMGRDVLSRILVGSRISLGTALAIVTISVVTGTVIGMVAGYAGGLVDAVCMRVVDVLLAFPTVVFALSVAAVLGGGIVNLIVALCLLHWVRYARVARGEAVLLRNVEYISAARVIGNSAPQVLVKYFIPGIVSKMLVLASVDFGGIILYSSSLSFLGMGAQPPSPDWGVMVSEAKDYIRQAPWMAIFPGLAIACASLAFNLLGDGIRDILDPHTRQAAQTA
jgi:peptide/nickel transport system permease protein